ncbi:hypothetical protein ACFL2V_13065 [Pseudomonadota bacterium]
MQQIVEAVEPAPQPVSAISHHDDVPPLWDNHCTCEACTCESDDRIPSGQTARHDDTEEGPAFEPI